jgi:hypothetical protein
MKWGSNCPREVGAREDEAGDAVDKQRGCVERVFVFSVDPLQMLGFDVLCGRSPPELDQYKAWKPKAFSLLLLILVSSRTARGPPIFFPDDFHITKLAS